MQYFQEFRVFVMFELGDEAQFWKEEFFHFLFLELEIIANFSME